MENHDDNLGGIFDSKKLEKDRKEREEAVDGLEVPMDGLELSFKYVYPVNDKVFTQMENEGYEDLTPHEEIISFIEDDNNLRHDIETIPKHREVFKRLAEEIKQESHPLQQALKTDDPAKKEVAKQNLENFRRYIDDVRIGIERRTREITDKEYWNKVCSETWEREREVVELDNQINHLINRNDKIDKIKPVTQDLLNEKIRNLSSKERLLAQKVNVIKNFKLGVTQYLYKIWKKANNKKGGIYEV